MESSFTSSGRNGRTAAVALMLLLTATYLVATGHGVLTIDVARDTYCAIEIAQGRALPLVGPVDATLS